MVTAAAVEERELRSNGVGEASTLGVFLTETHDIVEAEMTGVFHSGAIGRGLRQKARRNWRRWPSQLAVKTTKSCRRPSGPAYPG